MITLDGHSLTIEQLVAIARGGEPVRRDPSTDARVAAAEAIIARAVALRLSTRSRWVSAARRRSTPMEAPTAGMAWPRKRMTRLS